MIADRGMPGNKRPAGKLGMDWRSIETSTIPRAGWKEKLHGLRHVDHRAKNRRRVGGG
jgi:hypothetical protein